MSNSNLHLLHLIDIKTLFQYLDEDTCGRISAINKHCDHVWTDVFDPPPELISEEEYYDGSGYVRSAEVPTRWRQLFWRVIRPNGEVEYRTDYGYHTSDSSQFSTDTPYSSLSSESESTDKRT